MIRQTACSTYQRSNSIISMFTELSNFFEILVICNPRLERSNFLANTTHLDYLQHGWNNHTGTDYPRTAAG